MAGSNNKVTFGKMDAVEAFISMPVNSTDGAVEDAVKAKYANQIFSSYNAPNHLDD
jgi:hypothetical protein